MSTILVPGSSRHAERRSAFSICLAAACAVLLFAAKRGGCTASIRSGGPDEA
jgi:hypothetical protein